MRDIIVRHRIIQKPNRTAHISFHLALYFGRLSPCRLSISFSRPPDFTILFIGCRREEGADPTSALIDSFAKTMQKDKFHSHNLLR